METVAVIDERNDKKIFLPVSKYWSKIKQPYETSNAACCPAKPGQFEATQIR